MPWFVIDMLNIIMELALCQLFFTRFLDGFRSRPVIWAPVYLISFAAMSVCALFSVHSLVQLTVTVSTTFLIALTLFKDRLWKRLLFALLFLCFAFIAETLVFMMLTLLCGDSVGQPGMPRFIGMIATKLCMFWITVYISSAMRRRISKLPLKYALLIILIPLSSLLLESLLNLLVTESVVRHDFIVYISLASIIYMNLAVFDFINTYLDRVEFEVTKQILEQEHKNYRTLREHEDELRTIKHNIIHIVSGVKQSLKNNENAEPIIKDLDAAAERISSVVYSGNSCVDAVLNEKSRLCRLRNIRCSIRVSADKIYIKPVDMFVLLGNALDNAVEACGRLKDGTEPFVDIEIRSYESKLIIRIRNSADMEDCGNITELSSSKADKLNHGFGFRSIKAIVSAYDGLMKAGVSDGVFSLEMILDNVA